MIVKLLPILKQMVKGGMGAGNLWQSMVHHRHEMVCRSREPARSDWKPHHGLLAQDAADALCILLTADRLGQLLGKELTVVDEEVIALCESAECEGRWSRSSLQRPVCTEDLCGIPILMIWSLLRSVVPTS